MENRTVIAMTTPGVNRALMQVKLSPEKAELYHTQIRAMIDRIRAKDPTEPIPELWIAALEKDYIEVEIETEERPVNAPALLARPWTTYDEYLRTEDWKRRSADFKRRGGNKCQLCGATKARLNVHHNCYDRLGHELDTDVIVLCEPCHHNFHQMLGLRR